jgi:hypothetical protein
MEKRKKRKKRNFTEFVPVEPHTSCTRRGWRFEEEGMVWSSHPQAKGVKSVFREEGEGVGRFCGDEGGSRLDERNPGPPQPALKNAQDGLAMSLYRGEGSSDGVENGRDGENPSQIATLATPPTTDWVGCARIVVDPGRCPTRVGRHRGKNPT